MRDPSAMTREFYAALRREVMSGESDLTGAELDQLRGHYPIMMRPDRYPPALVTTIYVERRAPVVRTILEQESPYVFDAGCGYGSESFLFAAAGARVLAVDRSAARIAIARRRQRHYEKLCGRPLDVTFSAADLDVFDPGRDGPAADAPAGQPPEAGLSLTWLGSVLAAIPDQDALLGRLHLATRPGGRVMIADMNLLNPLFVIKEWRRRRREASSNEAFAREADFLGMVLRRNRRGALYYPDGTGDLFDDSQFFWPRTLKQLLRRTGFDPLPSAFSGFVPPLLEGVDLSRLETIVARIPLVRCGGYFYLVTGIKRGRTVTGGVGSG